MTSPYYVGGSVPPNRGPGQSAAIRAEFAAITASFAKLPTLSGMAGAVVRVNAAATALESYSPVANGVFYNGASGLQTSSGLTYDTNGKLSIAAPLTGDALGVTGPVAFSSSLSVGGKITNITNPTNPQDAATKSYVDAAATGLRVLTACRVATTANITLSGAQTIDGVSVIALDRVLVKAQTAPAENGIYVCAAGSWSRATDSDTAAEVTAGAFVFVTAGTLFANSGWTETATVSTLGTDAVAYAQFSGGATYSNGTGLSLTGSQFSIANTAVTASSYGSATSVPTFTVNAQGQLTAAAAVTISLSAATHITSGTLADGRLSANIPRLDQAQTFVGHQTVTGNVAASAQLSGATISVSGAASLGSLTLGTPLAIAQGGTAASDAATARTNLGLAIGTNVLAPNGSAASLSSFPTLNQNTTGTAANATLAATATRSYVPTDGALTNGGAYHAAAGFTINSADIAAGGTYTIVNTTGSDITITQGTATLRKAGTTDTGSRTLAAYGMATIRGLSAGVGIIDGAIT